LPAYLPDKNDFSFLPDNLCSNQLSPKTFMQNHPNRLKWGPYLTDRQWGTVREDYSANGGLTKACIQHTIGQIADYRKVRTAVTSRVATRHDLTIRL